MRRHLVCLAATAVVAGPILALYAAQPVSASAEGCVSSLEQTQCGLDIYGYVTHQDGSPVAGASLSDGAGDFATTDASGLYQFAEISPGNYQIVAQSPPPNGCNAIKTVAYDPAISIANGGTRADIGLPC